MIVLIKVNVNCSIQCTCYIMNCLFLLLFYRVMETPTQGLMSLEFCPKWQRGISKGVVNKDPLKYLICWYFYGIKVWDFYVTKCLSEAYLFFFWIKNPLNILLTMYNFASFQNSLYAKKFCKTFSLKLKDLSTCKHFQDYINRYTL